jgi:Spy/CpxP family protein refolding chaperone
MEEHMSRRIIQWVAGSITAVALTAVGIATIRAQSGQIQGTPPAQTDQRHPRGGRGFGGPFGGGAGGPFIPRVPDLTDAQRDQIKAIADRHQAEMRPLMEKLRSLQMALEDAIVTNPTDEATIRLKSADVASAAADLAVVRGQVYAEVVALLTPDQQQKLQQQREQMKERRGGGPRARRQ